MEIITSLLQNELSTGEINILKNTLFILLLLPLISTWIGIARHIIGIKSFNYLAPVVLTYSFLQLGFINYEEGYNFIRGLVFGLMIFSFVVIGSLVSHTVIQKIRLHYIPKATIIVTLISFSLCILIVAYTLLFGKKGLVYSDIFTIVMIAILSESVISSFARKNFENTINTFFQTLIISISGYLIISIRFVQDFIYNQTLIYLVVIIIFNYLLGRYVGLRLTEYWRFRSLIFSDTLNEYVQSNGNSKKKKANTGKK